MTDYRVWPATNGPNTDAGDPSAPVNLGLIFQVSSTCWAKAIHFYRGNTNITGPVKGRIFLVSSTTVVSGTSVDFVLSGTGWQTAALSTPVQLTANTSYKVTIHTDDNYTATGGYWATGAGVGGIVNGPLTAPDAGGAPLGIGSIQQGSFRYTSDPDLYPNSYFNGGQYWVDVTVSDVNSITIEPTGIASTAAIGSPTVTYGPITVAPTGIASTSAVGSPTVSLGPITVAPIGIASGSTVGTPSVSLTYAIAPTGIASTAAVGTPTVTGSIVAGGIPSTAVVGTPTVSFGPVSIAPTGIGSTAQVGSPVVVSVLLRWRLVAPKHTDKYQIKGSLVWSMTRQETVFGDDTTLYSSFEGSREIPFGTKYIWPGGCDNITTDPAIRALWLANGFTVEAA